MSDRDEVRRVAEEIAINEQPDLYPTDTHAEKRERWERKITTFLAQRESALQDQRDRAERDSQRLRERNLILEDEVAALQAQLHRALGEGARLREALERIAFPDVLVENDEGQVVTAQRLGNVAMMTIARKALASSPLSERAGEVLEELERCRRSPNCDWTGFEPLMDEMDALRAALAREGSEADNKLARAAGRQEGP